MSADGTKHRTPRHAVPGSLHVQTQEQVEAERLHRLAVEETRLRRYALRHEIPVIVDDWVTSKHAAVLLGIPNEGALRNMRCYGGGPPFIKRKRQVFYRLGDLAEWIVQHRYE